MRFCPHCGHDFEALEPVATGSFFFDPKGDFRFGDKSIRLSPAEHIIVGTLMAVSPNIVPRIAIRERIGTDSDGNVLDVHMTRIKNKLKALGAPNPIKSVWGRGVRWETSNA